jgi:hypothetical protein
MFMINVAFSPVVPLSALDEAMVLAGETVFTRANRFSV